MRVYNTKKDRNLSTEDASINESIIQCEHLQFHVEDDHNVLRHHFFGEIVWLVLSACSMARWFAKD